MSVFRYVPGGIGLLLVLALGVLVVAAAVLLATPADRRRDAARILLRLALVGYVAALLVITLSGGRSSGGVNLVPFAGITEELSNVNRELGVANIAGNVLLFVPLPILARLTWVPSWPRAFACGVGLSVAIELVQLGAGRSADIDDVLLNSAGALLGASAGWAVGTVAGRRRARQREQSGIVAPALD